MELPNQNVWQYLYPRLKKWETLTAFVNSETEETTSYKELLERSLRWAKELKKYFSGSKPPLIAFIMEVSVEYVSLVTGCYAIGAPFCTMKHNSAKDLIYVILCDLKPDVLVIESSVFENIKETIWKTGLKLEIYIKGTTTGNASKNISQILQSAHMLDINEAGKYDPASIATIAFSSGTTGKPKGIVVSHKSTTNNMTVLTHPAMFPLRPADEGDQETLLANLPLASFSVLYYTIIAAVYGAKVIQFPYRTLEDLLLHTKKYKPKYLMSRVSTFEEISNMDCAEDISSLKTVAVLGSPANYVAFEKLKRKTGGTILFQEAYGTTECGAMTMTPLNIRGTEVPGKLFPNCMAKIIDTQTGEIIQEPQKTGEILFKGPGMMDEYLNNLEATQKAIDAENWYHTGDAAYFNEEFCFRIIDRIDDLISVGDNMVSPSTIEMILKQHPSVIDVGVVGIPDVDSGEIVKAFIIQNGTSDAEEIIRFYEERAADNIKLTGGVAFVETLPRNHMGKLIRKFVREMAWFK